MRVFVAAARSSVNRSQTGAAAGPTGAASTYDTAADESVDTAATPGIARETVYVTNAVKHFKYVARGKRRIHSKPNSSEIEHCRWWLKREIDVIRPKLVVALGGTAAQSLIGRAVAVLRERGPQSFGPASMIARA
jgi:uracil-DNA glycosylase family 4